MNGPAHALAGAIAGGGLAYLLKAPPAHVAADGLLCSGWALVPDSDMNTTTIAKSAGPVTKIAATIIGVLSGGHRHATHTVLAAAVCSALSVLAVIHQTGHAGKWIMIGVLTILCSAAYRALKLTPSRFLCFCLGAATAVVLVAAGYYTRDLWWLAGLGILTHLILDRHLVLLPSGNPHHGHRHSHNRKRNRTRRRR